MFAEAKHHRRVSSAQSKACWATLLETIRGSRPDRTFFHQKCSEGLTEPPPNEWTPVVGSGSPEVSDARASTSVVYRGVQAAGR